jgi:hypothetical protein
MKRLIFAGIVTMLLAASSLVACGGGSCLNEFPCNVPDDVGDGSYDGGPTHAPVDAAVDADVSDAIDDGSTIDDAGEVDDAQPDSGDAADD